MQTINDQNIKIKAIIALYNQAQKQTIQSNDDVMQCDSKSKLYFIEAMFKQCVGESKVKQQLKLLKSLKNQNSIMQKYCEMQKEFDNLQRLNDLQIEANKIQECYSESEYYKQKAEEKLRQLKLDAISKNKNVIDKQQDKLKSCIDDNTKILLQYQEKKLQATNAQKALKPKIQQCSEKILKLNQTQKEQEDVLEQLYDKKQQCKDSSIQKVLQQQIKNLNQKSKATQLEIEKENDNIAKDKKVMENHQQEINDAELKIHVTKCEIEEYLKMQSELYENYIDQKVLQQTKQCYEECCDKIYKCYTMFKKAQNALIIEANTYKINGSDYNNICEQIKKQIDDHKLKMQQFVKENVFLKSFEKKYYQSKTQSSFKKKSSLIVAQIILPQITEDDIKTRSSKIDNLEKLLQQTETCEIELQNVLGNIYDKLHHFCADQKNFQINEEENRLERIKELIHNLRQVIITLINPQRKKEVYQTKIMKSVINVLQS